MPTPYTCQKLSEQCTAIEDGHVRCLLFTGRQKALLVDTGFGTGDLPALVGELTDLPLEVLNTHADRDHTGGNHRFDWAYMHPDDHARFQEKGGDPARLRPIYAGDTLDLGSLTLEVLHLPGHTPGSIALWEAATGTLVAGDTVQNDQVFLFGEGRDLRQYLRSLDRLRRLPIKQIYASHGEAILRPNFLRAFYKDAQRVVRGEIAGSQIQMMDMPVLLCEGVVGRFLVDLD